MSVDQRYEGRGVSSSKSEVHQAIKHLDKGLFPNAFCKVLPDLVAKNDDYCNIMHADTAGTKTSLAYIYWKETGDLDVWKGIIQDALVMNLDDMACVGCIQDVVISSTIGRNKNVIPAEVLSILINHTQFFIEDMSKHGINLVLAGGETADVGDIVRTIDVGFTTFGRLPKKDIVNIDIREGDYIVAFASYGQANYETNYNGGTGSNGLTSARHDVFAPAYRDKYPESFDPATPIDLVYCGSKMLTDTIQVGDFSTTIGKLVLSPTRTYMPVISELLKQCRKNINGLIHCSGGGQTKVMKFVEKPLHLIKDKMLPIPPLFKLIQSESGASWKEMYQVFNMGHRLEAYTAEISSAQKMIDIARSFNIDAKIIGRVFSSDEPKISIVHEDVSIDYTGPF